MKKNFWQNFIIFSALLIAFSLFAVDRAAWGQTSATGTVAFPIAELGNCKDKTDCKIYCDNPKNGTACLAFARKNNLMDEQDIAAAEKLVKGGGPGGCKSKEDCQSYCDDVSHINECLSYAEKNNMLSSDELAEARKVKAAIDSGVTPPACGGKKKCDAYCSESAHIEECVTFALKAGLMSDSEKVEAEKMIQAIKKGIVPPKCSGKACDEYCAGPAHFEECISFAEAAGFVSPEEAAIARKTGGESPGGCRGKEACDAFCGKEENMPVCIDFAVKHGMMDAKDAQMALKTGGKGPGGCKSKEECDKFCNDPANEETCFKFGEEHGLIGAEELQQTKEGDRKMSESLSNLPPQVSDCINAAVGADKVEAVKNGSARPSRAMGDALKTCFEQFGGGSQGESRVGPGGCKTPEECDVYCKDHMEECAKAGSGPQGEAPGTQQPMANPIPTDGGMPPPQGMPPSGGGSPEVPLPGVLPEGSVPPPPPPLPGDSMMSPPQNGSQTGPVPIAPTVQQAEQINLQPIDSGTLPPPSSEPQSLIPSPENLGAAVINAINFLLRY